MDRPTAINKVKEYAELVSSVYSPEKIVLFGSYAKNSFHENSDIDVAIIMDTFNDDFLKVSTTLCKLTRNIDYRIEPILVNTKNDKSGFVHDILQYGVIIYDKK